MIQSMTGYASSIIEIPIKKNEKISLSIMLKSLNSRYFEATCRLPYLLNNIEIGLQRLLKKQLHRGHVYVTVKIQEDGLKHEIIPAFETLTGYVDAINQIKKRFKIEENLSLQSLLQLPNVLQIGEKMLSKKTEDLILAKIDEKLIADLLKTRITEGKELKKDLFRNMSLIEKKLSEISSESVIAAKKKKKFLDQILKNLENFPENDSSTEKSLLEAKRATTLIEIEKIDINEEIVRAKSHLKKVDELLNSTHRTKGKSLDFILQEINREINTVASKCSDFKISSLTIDIKSALEKCREQAQNIV